MDHKFQALAEKYRPRRIKEFIGLKEVKPVLIELAANPYPSAWIFRGPCATGKTSTVLALAEEIPAQLHHIAAKSCTLERIEEVCRECHFIPGRLDDGDGLRYHVVLVDECGEMGHHAQLKWLSKLDCTEPLPQTILVFTCNTSDGLREPFITRCGTLMFTRDGILEELPSMLESIWATELGNEVAAPDLDKIANESGGNIRSALHLLEIEMIRRGRSRNLATGSNAVESISSNRGKELEMGKQQLKVHPIAELFPMMPEGELEQLAEDIKQNGLIHSLVRDSEGQLISGRNRLAACKLAGVHPRFVDLRPGENVVAYIVSENLARRNLTKGQQAMALAMIYPDAEKGGRGKKSAAGNLSVSVSFSRTRLSEARAVLSHSREMAQQVLAGTLTLDDALVTVKQKNQEAEVCEAQMARLRQDAPDLLDKVDDGSLTIAAAIATLDKRIDEQVEQERVRLERQRSATVRLQQLMTLLDPLSKSPGEWANEMLREVNLEFWTASPTAQPTLECFEAGATALGVFAQLWREKYGQS
jgi:ParB-like chromosome segregation protein Spo0J